MKPTADSMTTGRRWRFVKRYPCMSDELMDASTTPRAIIRNLMVPRLRKCPFDIDSVDWQRARLLGAGVDGCVYRVHFGDQGPFALKLFWIPDTIVESPAYSAVHRECQNAALLQLLRVSMDCTKTGPPLVHPNPMDFLTASENLFSFSEEYRDLRQLPAVANKPKDPNEPDRVPVMSMPRFAQCYGWLRCNVHELLDKMPPRIRRRGFKARYNHFRHFDSERTDFIGIVYEYIRSDDSDISDNNTDTEDAKDAKDTKDAKDGINAQGKPCRKAMPGEESPGTVERRYNTRSRTSQSRLAATKKAKEQGEHGTDTAKTKPAEEAATAATAATAAKEAKEAKHRERVSAVNDFLWLTGFDFCSQPLAHNWKNGVLVDHSEIIGPYSSGWDRTPMDTKQRVDWLLTPSE
ncbi:hypothetical protein SPBR_01760 [Sporothrix brasiliensis 5110]|uniref:Uncharacterized protein n=1 Tax=Sporothrix brasiliensis 5110 TaxID=1398154 RepID=A0A0C2FJL0_9PEZI|nr:uncharacterized protein SPBR_01760 [Sporothrix brasiliensis 5110]KIH91213.1 hypothetical protein SPBR_01760 [Sporothrix brasiliensis 5110]